MREPAAGGAPVTDPDRSLPPVLQAEAIAYAWPGQAPLWRALTLTIPPGVSWLGGDEGCGKTTLLRLLAGELAPQSGHVHCAGPVFWVDPRADGCDALTPVACFERVARTHAVFDKPLLADLVAALELAPHAGKRLDMLSTGTRRKVWLAAAFASGAALTLLDQPCAALDKRSVAVVTEVLADASMSRSRAWLVADYAPPDGVPLAMRHRLDAATHHDHF